MQRKLLFGPILAGGVLFAAATTAEAAIIVNLTPGTVHEIPALTGFTTNGDQMVGMSVTAFFVGGGSETVPWVATGVGAGAAGGANFNLSESGDTYSAADPWSLTVSGGTALAKLVIDAGAGGTVFDTSFGGAMGTANSALGRTFTTSQTIVGDITATYRDQIALAGNAPVGDLYRTLELEFTNFEAIGLTQPLRFSADTDTVYYTYPGGGPTPVTEPGTLALFGIGLAGLGLLRRRRNTA